MPDTDDQVEVMPALDTSRGKSDAESKPAQFTLRHAMVATTIVAIWCAAMRSEWFQFCGWLVPLIVLARSCGPTTRFVYRHVHRFASHGRSPAWSGLLAASLGSFATFVYMACVAGAASMDSYDRSLIATLAISIVVFITCFLALVLFVTSSFIFVVETFGRRWRDVPHAILCHALDAAVGGVVFSVSGLPVAWVTLGSSFNFSFAPLMSLPGAIAGLIIGGHAVNEHLDFLDTARRKMTTTEPLPQGPPFLV